MGGVASSISSGMRSTMEETQETMLKRQIELNACQIRERQMAMNLARQRDLTNWIGGFYAIAVPLMVKAARSGTRAAAAPILPLTFILGYNLDMAYGNKMDRIRTTAEEILRDPVERATLLGLPLGEPRCVCIVDTISTGVRSDCDRHNVVRVGCLTLMKMLPESTETSR